MLPREANNPPFVLSVVKLTFKFGNAGSLSSAFGFADVFHGTPFLVLTGDFCGNHTYNDYHVFDGIPPSHRYRLLKDRVHAYSSSVLTVSDLLA